MGGTRHRGGLGKWLVLILLLVLLPPSLLLLLPLSLLPLLPLIPLLMLPL